jgi:hypothetical protein
LTDYEVNAELFLDRCRCAESGESKEKSVLNMHVELIYMYIPVYMFEVFRIYCSVFNERLKRGEDGNEIYNDKNQQLLDSRLLADTGEYPEVEY